MKSAARLTLGFDDVDSARAIAASVAIDDDRYVRTARRGRTLIAEATADGPMSLLHTLDEYLACIGVAERTTREAHSGEPARRSRR